MDEELDNDPTFPRALFLVEGMAKEQDAPSPSTPVPVNSPWLTPGKSPQHHPIYTGGAKPEVSTKLFAGQSQSQSSPKQEPEPINYPLRWIHVRWRGLDTLIDGKKSKPVRECPWEARW